MQQHEAANEQTLLAMLLSDSRQLTGFLADRLAWLAAHTADQEAIDCLMAISADALLAQHETLVAKRWHAVLELVPESSFGNSAINRSVFAGHAERFWPQGHRRHERDALAFLRYCQSIGITVSPAEIARLEIQLGLRRFRVLPVRLCRRGRLRPALLFMHRFGGRSCREHLVASL